MDSRTACVRSLVGVVVAVGSAMFGSKIASNGTSQTSPAVNSTTSSNLLPVFPQVSLTRAGVEETPATIECVSGDAFDATMPLTNFSANYISVPETLRPAPPHPLPAKPQSIASKLAELLSSLSLSSAYHLLLHALSNGFVLGTLLFALNFFFPSMPPAASDLLAIASNQLIERRAVVPDGVYTNAMWLVLLEGILSRYLTPDFSTISRYLAPLLRWIGNALLDLCTLAAAALLGGSHRIAIMVLNGQKTTATALDRWLFMSFYQFKAQQRYIETLLQAQAAQQKTVLAQELEIQQSSWYKAAFEALKEKTRNAEFERDALVQQLLKQASMTRDYQSLLGRVKTFPSVERKLQNQVQIMKSQRDDAQRSLSDALAQIESLDNSLADGITTMAELSEKNTDYERNNKLEIECVSLKRELKAAKDTIEGLQKEAGELKAAKDTTMKGLRKEVGELKTAKETIKGLQKEVAELKAAQDTIESLRKEVSELKEFKETSKATPEGASKVEDLRKELGKAMQEKEDLENVVRNTIEFLAQVMSKVHGFAMPEHLDQGSALYRFREQFMKERNERAKHYQLDQTNPLLILDDLDSIHRITEHIMGADAEAIQSMVSTLKKFEGIVQPFFEDRDSPVPSIALVLKGGLATKASELRQMKASSEHFLYEIMSYLLRCLTDRFNARVRLNSTLTREVEKQKTEITKLRKQAEEPAKAKPAPKVEMKE